jgi:hypothetical protein
VASTLEIMQLGAQDGNLKKYPGIIEKQDE